MQAPRRRGGAGPRRRGVLRQDLPRARLRGAPRGLVGRVVRGRPLVRGALLAAGRGEEAGHARLPLRLRPVHRAPAEGLHAGRPHHLGVQPRLPHLLHGQQERGRAPDLARELRRHPLPPDEPGRRPRRHQLHRRRAHPPPRAARAAPHGARRGLPPAHRLHQRPQARPRGLREDPRRGRRAHRPLAGHVRRRDRSPPARGHHGQDQAQGAGPAGEARGHHHHPAGGGGGAQRSRRGPAPRSGAHPAQHLLAGDAHAHLHRAGRRRLPALGAHHHAGPPPPRLRGHRRAASPGATSSLRRSPTPTATPSPTF